jgi:hypothetical protein
MVELAPNVRRHVLIATIASILVAGVGAFAAYNGFSRPIFYLFAAVAFAIAWLGIVTVPRWYRRSAQVTLTGPSMPGTVTLILESDSDSTALYAKVQNVDRVGLLIPTWDFKPLLGATLPAKLYIDPTNSRLVAIQIDDHQLWCIPPGRVLTGSYTAPS